MRFLQSINVYPNRYQDWQYSGDVLDAHVVEKDDGSHWIRVESFGDDGDDEYYSATFPAEYLAIPLDEVKESLEALVPTIREEYDTEEKARVAQMGEYDRKMKLDKLARLNEEVEKLKIELGYVG